jgi:hypothetical protein
MIIYLAGSCYLKECFGQTDVSQLHWLFSYEYAKKDSFTRATIPAVKTSILDSGIFTYLTSKRQKAKSLDWDKYIYEYAEFVKEHNIKNYVEVDIDRIIGLSEVKRLTAILEKKVGWKPMPVWHLNRGIEDWYRICRDYDYICFGAFLTDSLDVKLFKYLPAFLKVAKENNCRVHGLGFTRLKMLNLYKFDSVDSTAWTYAVRGGAVSYFDGTSLTRIPKSENYKRLAHAREAAIYSFNEWVKFQRYAEFHL